MKSTVRCGADTRDGTPGGCRNDVGPNGVCPAGHNSPNARRRAYAATVPQGTAVTVAGVDPLAARVERAAARRPGTGARRRWADRRSIGYARRALRRTFGLRRRDYDLVEFHHQPSADTSRTTVRLRRDDGRDIRLRQSVLEPGGRQPVMARVMGNEPAVYPAAGARYWEHDHRGVPVRETVVTGPDELVALLRDPDAQTAHDRNTRVGRHR